MDTDWAPYAKRIVDQRVRTEKELRKHGFVPSKVFSRTYPGPFHQNWNRLPAKVRRMSKRRQKKYLRV
jgi:hypothetical protein